MRLVRKLMNQMVELGIFVDTKQVEDRGLVWVVFRLFVLASIIILSQVYNFCYSDCQQQYWKDIDSKHFIYYEWSQVFIPTHGLGWSSNTGCRPNAQYPSKI